MGPLVRPGGALQNDRALLERLTEVVDRLTFGGNIIETGTQSYRLAQTLDQRAGEVREE